MERETLAATARIERLDRRVLLAANPVAEMYPFPSGESDFGDAPASYGTLRADNGAVHEVAPAEIRFGASIDIESNGLPSTNALGDDADNVDDEDGVSLPAAVPPGSSFPVTMLVANEPGMAMAWIDFGGDGRFDAGDLIYDGPVQQGSNTFNVAVPAGAKNGDTYARFRVSNDVIPGATGIGAAGEVEDYRIRIDDGVPPVTQDDFGDAPDSYGTTLAGKGARHQFQSKLILGEAWDSENDGQPSPNADKDDENPKAVDDEDGVEFSDDFRQNRTDTVRVTAGDDGQLSVWLDLDGNGEFDQSDLVFQDVIRAGANDIDISVPSGASAGQTFMRFRFSDKVVTSPIEDGGFGEVEDYQVTINTFTPPVQTFDFGDAPEFSGSILRYPTLLASDGARHSVTPGFSLGAVGGDLETDGQSSINATGDDIGGSDDEDAVFPQAFARGLKNAVRVNLRNSFSDARLDAWFDWNRDGDWNDAGEHAVDSVAVSPNALVITAPVDVPAGALVGDTYARYRLSRGNAVTGPGGFGGVGEVEDHVIRIAGDTVTSNTPVVLLPDSYNGNGVRILGDAGDANFVNVNVASGGLSTTIGDSASPSEPSFRLWTADVDGYVPDLGGDVQDGFSVLARPGSPIRVQLPFESLNASARGGVVQFDADDLIVPVGTYANAPTVTFDESSVELDGELLLTQTPGPGQAVRLAGLSVLDGAEATLVGPADAAWRVSGPVGTATAPGLDIESDSQLDIGDQIVLLTATGGGAESFVADQVASGYAGGAWNGFGIVSNATSSFVGVGYGSAGDVELDDDLGFALDQDDVLLKRSLYGDANLDAAVSILDFARLRSGFGQPDTVWSEGDFNYDASTSILDFALLRGGFGQSLSRPASIFASTEERASR